MNETTWEILGVPNEAGIIFFAMATALAAVPYGVEFALISADKFDFARKPIFKILGPGLVFLTLACFVPVWPSHSKSAQIKCKPDPDIPMSAVQPGTYRIPMKLNRWTVKAGYSISVRVPFWIMNREVSVGDVRRYLASIPKKERQMQLADWRNHDEVLSDSADTPASGVPRSFAISYAETLSSRTSCSYRLPEYDEWLAAVVVYGDENPALGSKDLPARSRPLPREEKPMPGKVYDLLGNLREWSSSGCVTGNLVLGEDYLTRFGNVDGDVRCSDATYYTNGFRVILVGLGK